MLGLTTDIITLSIAGEMIITLTGPTNVLSVLAFMPLAIWSVGPNISPKDSPSSAITTAASGVEGKEGGVDEYNKTSCSIPYRVDKDSSL